MKPDLARFTQWMRFPPDVDMLGRTVRAKGEGTIKQYLYTAGRYAEFLAGRDMSTETTREWIDGLTGNSARSKAHHIEALKALFFAHDMRLGLGKPKFTESLPRVLSEDELTRLIADARERTRSTDIGAYGLERAAWRYVLVMVFFGSGVRKDEGRKLRVEDVVRDGNEGTIHVREGKGGDDRYIAVEGEVVDAVDDWLAIRRIKSPWIFAGRDASKPASRHPIEVGLTQACRYVGIRDFHVHMARHSYATALARGDADAEAIRVQLGHKSVTTTQKYLHLTLSERRGHLPSVVGTTRPKQLKEK